MPHGMVAHIPKEFVVNRALPLLSAVAVLAAACASSGSSSVAPPTTMTPVTQRIVTPTSAVAFNTVNVNSGSNITIVTTVDAAWTALNVTYNEFKIPVTTLVDKDHLIGNDAFKVRRRVGNLPMQKLLDCGSSQGIQNAETYDILMSISSTVVPNPKGGVNLMTRIDATGKSPNFSRDASVNCPSTGELEKAIAEAVRKKVGS